MCVDTRTGFYKQLIGGKIIPITITKCSNRCWKCLYLRGLNNVLDMFLHSSEMNPNWSIFIYRPKPLFYDSNLSDWVYENRADLSC